MIRQTSLATFGLLLLTTACGSPPEQTPSVDDAVLVDGEAPPAGAPIVAAMSGPPLASAPIQDVTTFEDDELQQLVDQARAHAAVADERLAALVDSFIDEGLAALDRGDPAEAHAQFGHAYELDPANPVARDLYMRTGALLGRPDQTVGSLAQSARDLAAVRAQQREVLIDHKLELGLTASAAGDHDGAVGHFEDALALVRFAPGGATSRHSEADIAAMVAGARNDREQALARRDEELARRASDRQSELDFAEANRTQLRIEGLLRAASDAFLRDDYTTALDSLDEALRLDPRNERAHELRRITTRASYEADARSIRRSYRDEWIATFDDLEHDTLVPNQLLEFPTVDEWRRTVERGPKSFRGGAKAKSAMDQAVEERLDDVRIPMNFVDATLDEVVEHIRTVTGVNFIMSPDVEDVLFDNTYNVLDSTPQPVSRILRIVLEDQSIPEMTYTVRDGIARIITKDEARGDYVLEMYDVRDLAYVSVDHPTQDFNLLPSGTDRESFTEGPEEDEPLPLITEDTLLTLIQDNIAVDSWIDDPERTISQMPGTLIVRQTPEVHESISTLLTDLRRATGALVNIETRFVEVEDSFLEDIGVDLRGLSTGNGSALEDFGQANAGGVGTPATPAGIGTGIDTGAFYGGSNGDLKGRTENLFDSVLGETGVLTGGGGLSLEALFLDDTNVNAVLRAVTKYQNSNIVNAPSLTVRSGYRGNIKVLTNYTYVRDFEPEIAQGAVIAQPELDIARDGVVLDVRAVASADRRFITLELRPTVAELIPDETGDVLPEALVSLGTLNANNVTLQLPELKVQRVRTTATVPDGGTLLLGGLKTSLEQDFKSETPFLADIPLLGWLFQRQGEYVSKRKLLILLTASIITPEDHEPTGYPR